MASEADRQLASSFARLPTELVTRVARPLSTTDFCALRATCKLIDHKLLDQFAYEFFRRKQFMITPASLQALKDISTSRFSDYLSHLVIGTDQLLSTKWDSSIPVDDKRRFRKILDEQKLLGHVGFAALFQDAIATLPRLNTLDIRDFNSPTRFRDGQYAQWRSYGMGDLRKAGTVGFGNIDWATCVFQNALLGAAAANAPLKNLEVLSRRNGCLQDSSLSLPKPLAPDMAALLSGLTKLHLDIIVSWEDLKFVGLPNLCYLLQNTPNVNWLRLNFDMALADYGGADDKGWVGFLAWLAKKPPASNEVVATYDTPPTFQLTQLDLGRIVVSPDHLLDIVTAYPTLQTLALSRVCLTEPTGTATPPSDSGTAYLVTRTLKGLDKTDLKKFTVRSLVQRTGDGRGGVRWKNSRGGIAELINLRSEPGRSQFKDASSLISFQIQIPARELLLVTLLMAEYYAASDDGSDSDGGEEDDEEDDEENDGDEADGSEGDGD